MIKDCTKLLEILRSVSYLLFHDIAFFFPFCSGRIRTKHSQMTLSNPSGSIIVQEDPWISRWTRLSLTFARTQLLTYVILATVDTLEIQVTF